MKIYNRNLQMIKKGSQPLYQVLTQSKPIDEYIIEPLPGNKNYIIENKNARCFLHSIYDIDREVKKTFEKINKHAEILIIFGIGCGYHLKYIKRNFRRLKRVIIIEPNLDIFKELLKKHDLNTLMSGLGEVSFIINQTREDAVAYLGDIIFKKNTEKFEIAYTMSYRTLYGQYFAAIYDKTIEFFRNQIVNVATVNHSKDLWVINTFRNLKQDHYLLDSFHDIFKDKPVILVSAGPSLNKNIDLLREVKEKAIIVAVGSAIKILDNNDIKPHFRMAIDGWPNEKKIFDDIKHTDVPLIYADMLFYDILPNYSGKKLKIIMDSDYLGQYISRNLELVYTTVKSGFSVANVALDLFCKSKCSKVIFMGQDLAYTEGSLYAKGSWKEEKHQEFDMAKYIQDVDVYGNKIYTTKPFHGMKSIFEKTIKRYKESIEFIDATEGGLKIEYTKVKTFKEVMEQDLAAQGSKNARNSIEYLLKNDGTKAKLEKGITKAIEENTNIKEKLDYIWDQIISINEKGVDTLKLDDLEERLKDMEKAMNDLNDSKFYTMVIANYVSENIYAINKRFETDKKVARKEELHSRFEKLANIVTAVNQIVYLMDALIKEFKGERELRVVFSESEIPTSYNIKNLLSKQYNAKGQFNRMDIIVRYLAIEEYYGKNDYGFKLYEKMQKARKQSVHNIDRFKKLIKSIEENGFDEKSSILVDTNLQLIDGSHRLACALYYDVEGVPIDIQSQLTNIEYSIDWFINAGFKDPELKIIQKKQKDILKEKEIFFVAMLWPPVQMYFDEITEELEQEYTLLSIKDFAFENDHEFNAAVRGQYAIDDIENWKIEKKLEYMKDYEKKIRIITLDVGDPGFRKKAKNNKPISTEVEKIKRKYREKYSKKIDNYFYDIIMHIGDNYEHSEHMMKVMQKDINIVEFLKSISNYKYAITKIDVPYMPSDFPHNYPLNKDMDIICEREDFEEICKKVFEFRAQYLNEYQIKIIKQTENFRVRFELNNFLIYQIDISCNIKGLRESFIRNAIQRRKRISCYYTFDKKDEIAIRISEYNRSPGKKHHYNYIIENKQDLKDLELSAIFEPNILTTETKRMLNI